MEFDNLGGYELLHEIKSELCENEELKDLFNLILNNQGDGDVYNR